MLFGQMWCRNLVVVGGGGCVRSRLCYVVECVRVCHLCEVFKL